MLATIALIIIVLSLSSCRSQVPVILNGHHFRDTTKMIAKSDTFFIHDSVFVKEFTVKGVPNDTVYKVEHRTIYKYKVQQLHDTLAIIIRDSVPYYTAPMVEQKQSRHNDMWIALSLMGIGLIMLVISGLANKLK